MRAHQSFQVTQAFAAHLLSRLEEVIVGRLGDECAIGCQTVALQLLQERRDAMAQRERRRGQQHGLHHRSLPHPHQSKEPNPSSAEAHLLSLRCP